jgi:hypothetical protein
MSAKLTRYLHHEVNASVAFFADRRATPRDRAKRSSALQGSELRAEDRATPGWRQSAAAKPCPE